MDWNSGYSALYELQRVDPVSWLDAGSLDFTSGKVTRSVSDLIESANLQMTERIREGWIRVYLKARQAGDGAQVAVFTGLAMTPQRNLDGTRISYPTECYSVLKPAEDTLTPRGYYVPAGAIGPQVAAELLSVGPAPVEYDEDGPELLEAIVTEDRDTNLSTAWKIVNTIGWRIRISGDGVIRVCPAATEPAARYDADENDAIEPKITDADDWYDCPNCMRVVSGDKYVEVRDEDPDSMLSIDARKAGRGGTGEIWQQDSASAIGRHESLAEYAFRKLEEAQAHAREIKYYRRYNPDLTIGDIVTLHYPGVGLDGNFRILNQTLTLGHAVRTDEKVVAV